MSYVSEASELYTSLNPDTPYLSSFDYTMIAEWEKQEIPLSLVLDAIRTLSSRPGSDERISLLKQEIKSRYADWLQKTVPSHPAKERDQTVWY